MSVGGYGEFLRNNMGLYTKSKEGITEVVTQYQSLNNQINLAQAGIERTQGLMDQAVANGMNADMFAESMMKYKADLDYATKAYGQFDEAVTKTNPKLAELARNGNVSTKELNQFAFKSKSAAAGQLALAAGAAAANAAISFGISLLIQAAVSAFVAFINREKDMINTAKEMAETFKQTNDDIEENISKIKELKDAIASGTLTESEAYEKKKELLDIQNSLYDTYGKQVEGIDLVNGRYEEEIKNLRKINKEKAIEAQKNGGIAGDNAAEKTLNKKNNRFINNGMLGGWYTEYGLGASTFFSKNTDVKDGIIKKALELGGTKHWNGAITFDNQTVEEVMAIYDELIDYVQNHYDTQDESVKNWLTELSKRRGKLNDDDYKNAKQVRKDMAFEYIVGDDEAFAYYEKIQKAMDEYNEAVLSGDKVSINQATETLRELKNGIMDVEQAAEHSNVAELFNDLFEPFDYDINLKELEEAITRGMNIEGSRWNEFIGNLSGKTDVEAQAYLSSLTESSSEYEFLHTAMEMFNVDAEQVIKVLEALGIVEKTTVEETNIVTKTFGTLVEGLKEAKEKIQKFDSAIDKISIGEKLSGDEINELLAIDPSLLDSVEKLSDGYTIAFDKIDIARKKLLEKQKADVREEIKENKNEIDALNNEINQLETNKTDVSSGANKIKKDIENYEQLNKQLIKSWGGSEEKLYETADQETIERYEYRIRAIQRLKDKLKESYGIEYNIKTIDEDIADVENKINDQIKEKKDKIEDVNAETAQYNFLLDQMENPIKDWASSLDTILSKVKSIGDAYNEMMKSQRRYGSVSSESLLDFIQSTPNWQDFVKKNDTTGKIELTDFVDNSSGLTTALYTALGVDDLIDNSFDQMEADYIKALNAVDQNPSRETRENLEVARKNMLQYGNSTKDVNEEWAIMKQAIQEVIKEITEIDPTIASIEQALDDINHTNAIGGYYSEDAYDAAYAAAVGPGSELYNKLLEGGEQYDKQREQIDEEIHSRAMAREQRHYDERKKLIEQEYADTRDFAKYQQSLADLNDEFYGAGSTLGSTKEGADAYKDNLREIAGLGKEGFDRAIAELDRLKERGEIDIHEYWEAYRKEAEDKLSGVAQLSEDYQAAMDNYDKAGVQEQYEYDLKLLERSYENGRISTSRYLTDLKALWQKYYKDKKAFMDEDYEAQKALLDATKSGVQEQIDALNDYNDELVKPYEEEIDALNEVKDKYDEVIDEKIKALNKQKDAIEESSKAQERENDLIKAKMELEKASHKTRIVYSGNGVWEAKRDESAYQDALKNYKDAQKQGQTDAIDNAIKALEKEKEARDEAIDKEIKERNEAVANLKAPIETLTKVLEEMISDKHNIDPDFLNQMLGTDAGKTAWDKVMSQAQSNKALADKYGQKLYAEKLSANDVQSIISDVAAANNMTEYDYAKSLGLDLPALKSQSEQTKDAIQSNTEAVTANTNALLGEVTEATTSDLKSSADEKANARMKTLEEAGKTTASSVQVNSKTTTVTNDTAKKVNDTLAAANKTTAQNTTALKATTTAANQVAKNFGDEALVDDLTKELNGSRSGKLKDGTVIDRYGNTFKLNDEKSRDSSAEAEAARKLPTAIKYSDWKKKHNADEWQTEGQKNKNPKFANMTMEEYYKLAAEAKKAEMSVSDYYDSLQKTEQKTDNKQIDAKLDRENIKDLTKQAMIVALKDIDPEKLKTEEGKELLKQLTSAAVKDSFTVTKQPNVTTATTANDVTPNAVTQNPVFNCTINIEGSADQKTVDAFKTELNKELIAYTNAMAVSIRSNFAKQ